MPTTHETERFALQLRTWGTRALHSAVDESGLPERKKVIADEIARREAGGDRVRFVHDCLDCTWIATIDIGGKLVDFYRHERDYGTEYVWRFGNNGPDYYSTTEFKRS
jgi:hypothetical protein